MKRLAYIILAAIILTVLTFAVLFVAETERDLYSPADEFTPQIEALCNKYGLYESKIDIEYVPDKSASTPHYIVNLHAKAPHNLNGDRLLEFLEKYKQSGGEIDGNVFFIDSVYLNNYFYTTRGGIIYKELKQIYPEPTPEPTPTPKPSSGFKPYPSKPDSDPYNAKDYAHPDDFYDNYYDDFFDYEDALYYYNVHNR